MARVLHNDHCGDDLCDDLRDDSSGSCDDHHKKDCGRDHHRGRRHHRKHNDLIPVGRVSVDCTPVVFKSPGQVQTVVTCQGVIDTTVPITRTVLVEVPTAFGCVLSIPVTETFDVPVQQVVNVPPVLTPIPTVVCPQGILFGTGF